MTSEQAAEYGVIIKDGLINAGETRVECKGNTVEYMGIIFYLRAEDTGEARYYMGRHREGRDMVLKITANKLIAYALNGETSKYENFGEMEIISITPTSAEDEMTIWYNDELLTLNSSNSEFINCIGPDDSYIYGNLLFIDPTRADPERIDNEIPYTLVPNFDTNLLEE